MIQIKVAELTEASAMQRYTDSQMKTRKAEVAKNDADRVYEGSRVAEAQDKLLVLDLKERASGLLRVVSRGLYTDSYGHYSCFSKTNRGEDCRGRVPSVRTVVFQGNIFSSGVFCNTHRRHAAHFGVMDCKQCGSTKLIDHDPERTKMPEGFSTSLEELNQAYLITQA